MDVAVGKGGQVRITLFVPFVLFAPLFSFITGQGRGGFGGQTKSPFVLITGWQIGGLVDGGGGVEGKGGVEPSVA